MNASGFEYAGGGSVRTAFDLLCISFWREAVPLGRLMKPAVYRSRNCPCNMTVLLTGKENRNMIAQVSMDPVSDLSP